VPAITVATLTIVPRPRTSRRAYARLPMHRPLVLDPLLGPAGADAVVELWHRYGEYGQYSEEGHPMRFAADVPQRWDAASNYVRTHPEDGRLAAARTNYFRETYAYGDEIRAEGVQPFLRHEALVDAARRIHGREVVEPAIVYANVLLPGQELAVHTDVPEFRGANRTVLPQWLLVVMLHSGLFEAWRMPIATAICYFGHASGGELTYFVDGRPHTYEPRHDTAVVLDTDTVFHGVERVAGDEAPLHALRRNMRLRHEGDQRWTLRSAAGDVVHELATDDLRYSVSWKAYCFADEAERSAWATHADDLTLEVILDRLLDDLGEARPAADADLARLLIDRYIRFPQPA
jgi:hypothetical protein